jgi:hypothetical protein
MTWFRKMANSVIGDNGEILEYRHLIANHATRATWQHSYGNEIGQLAQGMPGCNASTNTIMFIKKNQVPQDRAKDVTYGLITTLIRPEKLDEPNRTRLVCVCSCPLVMRGDTVNHALTSTSSPPQ